MADFVPQLLRLRNFGVPSEWRAPALPERNEVNPEPVVDALAAAVGSLTHACLELIANDPEAWPPQCVGERQAGFERWLASRGWARTEAQDGAARVAVMLSTTLSSADGRWVLRHRPGASAELALTRIGTGPAVTRVVDRCFVEDGVRWIVDYKTADFGAGAGYARLADHARRYRPQLESYAALFDGEGLPRRLAVLYVAHGVLATLEYNSTLVADAELDANGSGLGAP
jgi:ATP-dependent exoDNAse (exonuclease V) beta subunit